MTLEPMDILTPMPVLLSLLGAGVALLLSRQNRMQTVVSVLTLASVLAVNVMILATVHLHGTHVVAVGGWEPPFGIVLVADQLSALMLVISSIVTFCVLLYAIGQEMTDGTEDTPVSIFNPTYLVLCAGVFNAFLAGDLFNLYVSFEMFLVASYVLLTLGATEQRIRAGTTYIVVSLLSSLIFLLAIGFIYGSTGTVNIAQLSERLAELPNDVQMVLHIVLIVAFGIKAAVFPLSFWLPDSYPTAPAPVTAVFAGLLTKVGIYAIIRTETIIFVNSDLNAVLMVVALLTMVVGILGAVAQSDIKRLLSFTLVSHIGYMVFGVALGNALGLGAAIYYTVHHITVQTTLFLAIGLVEVRGGSTSTRRLGGLMVLAPALSVLFFVPAMNLAGIPPLSGFIGKLGLFQAGIAEGTWLGYLLVGAGALTSLLTLYAIGKVWNFAFWRSPADAEEPNDELVEEYAELKRVRREGGTVTELPRPASPRMMTAVTTVMVAVSVLLTVFAGPIYDMAMQAAQGLEGGTPYIDAVLYPGGRP
ncbi:Na+/H+ antiporter subunit D [Sediminivirga luteola]|uniref:Na+/H+ antiporter subunit D n=1 Tax=Sediminivirga luteola TaxID=1774748 RepID=UPI001F563853|nr:Na+/H+ antiporter subunit D [Sediminivirga luteola]MCI2264456.1 Na+/H+ antiporter subunit D [Sediminivirga luteola]